jgi:hypothetical protein
VPSGRLVFPPPTKAIREGLVRLQATLYADRSLPGRWRRRWWRADAHAETCRSRARTDEADESRRHRSPERRKPTPCYEVSGSVFLPNLLIPTASGGPSVVAGACVGRKRTCSRSPSGHDEPRKFRSNRPTRRLGRRRLQVHGLARSHESRRFLRELTDSWGERGVGRFDGAP